MELVTPGPKWVKEMAAGRPREEGPSSPLYPRLPLRTDVTNDLHLVTVAVRCWTILLERGWPLSRHTQTHLERKMRTTLATKISTLCSLFWEKQRNLPKGPRTTVHPRKFSLPTKTSVTFTGVTHPRTNTNSPQMDIPRALPPSILLYMTPPLRH